MKEKAIINGIEVNVNFAGIYHEIKSKAKLGLNLTPKDRSFYLLFIATLEEAMEYIKNEKKK